MEPTETTAETAPPAEDDGFEWMIVEVYGHRRHGGRVREEDRFGAKMMRIDVPSVLLEPAEPQRYIAPAERADYDDYSDEEPN